MRLNTFCMTPRPNLRFGPPGVAALALFALAIVWSGGASAQSSRAFELFWDASGDCPPAAEVERDIARLIGESSHERTVHASASVTGNDETGWKVRLRMETGGEVSERAISAPTCRAIAKAVALVVAIAIEPRAASGEPPPPPPSPPPPPPPPPPPEIILPKSLPREKLVLAFVALGPSVAYGLMPRVGVGGELDVGLKVRWFLAEATGALYAPDNITVKAPAGGRFTLWSAGVRACGKAISGQVELFGCGDAIADRLSGKGFGVTNPGSAATTLVAVGIGPRLDVHLGPILFLRADVEGNYAPGRASFVLENVGHVFTAMHLGVGGRLAVGGQF
jgi:hypothetical protein